MAGQNDFKAFATGESAYTMTPSELALLTTFLENGFQSGIVDGARFNTILRQSCAIAAAMGAIVAGADLDALDDGNTAALAANIAAALRSGLVQQTVNIVSGDGLTGGGSLEGSRTIHLGTPGACTPTSGNAVSADSHTHSISFPATSNANGYAITLPGGFIFQMGTVSDTPVEKEFPVPFKSDVKFIGGWEIADSYRNNGVSPYPVSLSRFRIRSGSEPSSGADIYWIAGGI